MRVVLFAVVVVATVFCVVDSTPVAIVALVESESGMCHGMNKASDLDSEVLRLRRANLNYTCVECMKMVDVLQDMCKEKNAVSKPYPELFENTCFDKTLRSSAGYEPLRSKCTTFYNFVQSLYCPLDPCVQITTQAMHAPTAICTLLKCSESHHGSGPSKVDVPWTCPQYVSEIFSQCAKVQADTVAAKNVGINATTLCHHLPEYYLREGCEVTANRLSAAVAPQALCASALCNDGNTTKSCQEINFPVDQPVPVREYQEYVYAHSDDCRSSADLNIVSASFGSNCGSDQKNNILKSVKEACEGKKRCTFGNQNIPGRTSKWSPFQGGSCKPEFAIEYRCGVKGKVLTATAPESAKFMAVPLICNGH
eukprot:c5683_g1_i1.p1 GENE.c5683_g1_i1~~c5683_g1_i1.p1  ORF type:complete len:387 (-),score=107.05 c5683_g1_i1:145-1245(-)